MKQYLRMVLAVVVCVMFSLALLGSTASAAELACSKQGSVRSQNGVPTSVA